MRRSLWVGAAACALTACAQPVAFRGTMGQIEATPRPAPTRQQQRPQATPVQAEIALEAQLSQDGFPADAPTSFMARIRVRPETIEGLPKPPVSVALVLDTSGSMAGEPMAKAKAAAVEFVNALGDDDSISLVAFHSVTETLVPLRTLDTAGRTTVLQAIDTLQADGTTDLSGGLNAGLAQVRHQVASGGVARIVLLSDGRPNDAKPVFPVAKQAARQGVTVTALGLGLEYDEALLGKVAQLTGGKFHFAESPDMVAHLLLDEVMALQRIVGRGAQLIVSPGPGVTIERVLGPAQASGPQAFAVQIGDLAERRERDVFVVLKSQGHTQGATIEVLDAHLSFHDPFAKKNRRERVFLSTRSTDSTDDIEFNRDVELTAARARAADEALSALALARSGDLRAAKKRIALAIARTKRDAKRFDDEILRGKLTDLEELRQVLPTVVPPKAHRQRVASGLEVPVGVPEGAPVGGLGAKRSHAKAMTGLGF